MLPNLLLAGAPKCGTTSVYEWLVSHPEVSGGVEKEVFYLVDETDYKYRKARNWKDHQEQGYDKLFPKRNKWVVDGTTITMYQKSALEYSERHLPKVIFFIREPAIRVYSNFKYHKNNRSRLSRDFSFFNYIESLENGNDFAGNTQLKNAVQHSFYVDYVKKFDKKVGSENIKIVVFEEFIRSPREGMKDISRWLEIDEEYYDEYKFVKKNESIEVKSIALNRLKESISPYLNDKLKYNWMRSLYRRLNNKVAARFDSVGDEVAIDRLRSHFSGKNQELSETYGIDISFWNEE